MCEKMTETIKADRGSDTVYNESHVEKIEDNETRRVGDGVETFDSDEIKTVKPDDSILKDDGDGDDDLIKDDDGIGDDVDEYSDGVEPFLEDDKTFPSIVKYRLLPTESEEIIEHPKIIIRRRAEVEKTVSLRIAAAILALSVLIYTAFVIYTEPLRQVIVNIFKDFLLYFTNTPRLTELTIVDDKTPISSPKI